LVKHHDTFTDLAASNGGQVTKRLLVADEFDLLGVARPRPLSSLS
jgi:hypothetical protein